jgi:hypothetical protein
MKDGLTKDDGQMTDRFLMNGGSIIDDRWMNDGCMMEE